MAWWEPSMVSQSVASRERGDGEEGETHMYTVSELTRFHTLNKGDLLPVSNAVEGKGLRTQARWKLCKEGQVFHMEIRIVC